MNFLKRIAVVVIGLIGIFAEQSLPAADQGAGPAVNQEADTAVPADQEANPEAGQEAGPVAPAGPAGQGADPAAELLTALDSDEVHFICLRRRGNPTAPFEPWDDRSLDDIFNLIRTKIAEIGPSKWVIVMFSEGFWGRGGRLLLSSAVNAIVQKCIGLTRENSNIIIHTTFLHAFNIKGSEAGIEGVGDCDWVKNYMCDSKDLETALDANNGDGRDSSWFKNSDVPRHLANYSLVIWKGRPLAIYRKARCGGDTETIPDEPDKSWCYEFGNYTTYSLVKFDAEPYKSMANVFAQNEHSPPKIITRICADMSKRVDDPNACLLLVPGLDAPRFGGGRAGLNIILVDDKKGINLIVPGQNMGEDDLGANRYLWASFALPTVRHAQVDVEAPAAGDGEAPAAGDGEAPAAGDGEAPAGENGAAPAGGNGAEGGCCEVS